MFIKFENIKEFHEFNHANKVKFTEEVLKNAIMLMTEAEEEFNKNISVYYKTNSKGNLELVDAGQRFILTEYDYAELDTGSNTPYDEGFTVNGSFKLIDLKTMKIYEFQYTDNCYKYLKEHCENFSEDDEIELDEYIFQKLREMFYDCDCYIEDEYGHDKVNIDEWTLRY